MLTTCSTRLAKLHQNGRTDAPVADMRRVATWRRIAEIVEQRSVYPVISVSEVIFG